MSDKSLGQIEKIRALRESADNFLSIENHFIKRISDEKSYLKESGFDVHITSGSYDISDERIYYKFPSLTISSDYSKLPYGSERDRFEFCWFKISSTKESPEKYEVYFCVENIRQNFECIRDEIDSFIETFLELAKEFSKIFKNEKKKVATDEKSSKIFFAIILILLLLWLLLSLR